MNNSRLMKIKEKVLSGRDAARPDAEYLLRYSGNNPHKLFAAASEIRDHFEGSRIDLCAIVNAKSGRCPEDCSYCAQSSRSTAEIASYNLLDKKSVLDKAKEAKKGGAKRFCIVTSGRKVSGTEIMKIADMIRGVRKLGLLPCATLGLLSRNELRILRQAGLVRYHNNLETSERFFPGICSTHTFRDKTGTILNAKEEGLSVCSGGIFGLGETWKDRIDMAFSLRELQPDSVPINFFTAIKGTRLGSRRPLAPLDALRIISLYRFILPDKQIRVCGGRLQTLGELNPLIFFAGASGLLIGNYLTTLGRGFEDDIGLIRQLGFSA